MFLGLSVGNLVTQEMVRTMADRPIIFAMANPDPEISYPDALEARPDALVATGRSDYPNQVNNVLGFPFIFRGALDVRATAISEEMKVAAARALAALAHEPVSERVLQAYGGRPIQLRRRLPHPQAVRRARAVVGGAGGGRGGDARAAWPAPRSTSTATASGCAARPETPPTRSRAA